MISCFRVGPLDTNCYFLVTEKSRFAAVVDPGDDAEYLVDLISASGILPKLIVLTHGHFDHVLAAKTLESVFQIPVFCDSRDKFLLDRMKETAEYYLGHAVPDEPPLNIKNIFAVDFRKYEVPELVIIHTPGHTPGGISLYLPNESLIITGDLVFADGAIGRTDHSYSNRSELNRSLKTVFTLPDDTVIYPGHGPKTTVKRVKLFYQV
jgi:glyoxylase-like metal-dependent hydrolase (beta-lactamase superfamily II)